MKDLIKKKWFRTWILLTISSSLISFIGSYGYYYVLALLFPLAQLIGLNKIKRTNLNLIWLLHFPFWLYVLSLNLSSNQIIIAIIINSLIGEILLTIIFNKFSRFIWMLSNVIALGLIYGGIQIYSRNDFIQIVVMMISFGISGVISGFGLEYGYLKEKERTTTLKNNKGRSLE